MTSECSEKLQGKCQREKCLEKHGFIIEGKLLDLKQNLMRSSANLMLDLIICNV